MIGESGATPLLPLKKERSFISNGVQSILTSRRKRHCVSVAWILALATIIYLYGVTLTIVSKNALQSHGIIPAFDAVDYNLGDEQNEELFLETEISKTNKSGYVLLTPGCRIPNMAAKSNEVQQYISTNTTAPKCDQLWAPMTENLKQRGPPLVFSNLTALWIDPTVLVYYNISQLEDIACCYRSFYRVQQNPEKYDHKAADNSYRISNKCVPFPAGESSVTIEKEEYVRIECKAKITNDTNSTLAPDNVTVSQNMWHEVYRDFHAFIPIKPEVEERCSKIQHNPDQVSVLVLGIDAVSRLNMERELPLLRQILMSPPLDAISLMGYNKVADNTFPNLVPMLMGISETELKNVCNWTDANKKIDPCPFMWKQYSARGYRTGYAEDCAWMSTFNYGKTGFVESPVDYYGRPFIKAAEKEQAHEKVLNVDMCVGPRLALANILTYIEKFCIRFAKERSISFFWTNSISHDILTMPHNGDAMYTGLLRNLLDQNALERSVLLVVSDHGIRWGGIRKTYQGRLEERLPFAFLSFPKWFRERFPAAVANVRRNARNRLTTPFDIHETLLDLLDPGALLEATMIRQRTLDMSMELQDVVNSTFVNASVSLKKGISLFLPIPSNRTCSNANIPPHYCACHESSPILVDEPIVQQTVQFVIDDLNSRLKNFRQCAQLKLNSVLSAQRSSPNAEIQTQEINSVVDYLVVFETNPGGALFEATVRESVLPMEVQRNETGNQLQLTGGVSRINRYGNQSRCVADYNMKLYCFCK